MAAESKGLYMMHQQVANQIEMESDVKFVTTTFYEAGLDAVTNQSLWANFRRNSLSLVK